MKKFILLTVLILAIATQSQTAEYNGNRVYSIGEVKVTAERISKNVFEKQILCESGGRHIKNGGLITSYAGAVGIAQFLPSTWNWLKKVKVLPKDFDINSEEDQLKAHKIFMYYLWEKDYGIKYDKTILALASYNAGSGRVRGLIKKYGNDWLKHAPKQTKKYIRLIVG